MKEKISSLFGVPAPESQTVEVREDTSSHPMIPLTKGGYIYRQEVLSDFLGWVKGAAGEDPLLITGPTGSGKSTIVEQVAAKLRQPVYTISCHDRLEATDLYGRFVVRNGAMTWVDGPVIAGLKDKSGAWIVLDEYDTMDPGTLVGLNPVFEGRRFVVPETGEIINPASSGARIICTGNTAGMGDLAGEYLATKRQNVATMGRFAVMEVGYPLPQDEEKVMAAHRPDLPEVVRKGMVEVANLVRQQYEAGEMPVIFCTRSLVRWAYLAMFFRKKKGVNYLIHALNRAIGFKYEPVVREALCQITQRVFGQDAMRIT